MKTRTPTTRNAARLHIAEGSTKDKNRWLVEAVLEFCLTLDDASVQITKSLELISDRLSDIEKRLQNVESAIDGSE